MSSILLIIASRNYQDVELAGTMKGLAEKGFTVTIASTVKGVCSGKFGGKTIADIALKDVKVDDFERIAFIGGPGAEVLKDDQEALRIAKEAVAKGKVLGAICIAPVILAVAGVLQGKKATVWDADGEQARFIESCGATFTGEAVTVDGQIVTANGAPAAEKFGRTLASL
ncbi:MAG: DJ-1/PfpI family protein [Candidatus Peribacteraceae bacterium]|nr:DJ-1/PfpI family protein [Candidatus Peribacteraceae bacterium]